MNFPCVPIMLSQRFSHYVIEEKLGEGGMGVVYRARDEKLQRDVALKFLGTLPTGSSASHERALQEARAISALNHRTFAPCMKWVRPKGVRSSPWSTSKAGR
jgi:serine/threonine protein kinase